MGAGNEQKVFFFCGSVGKGSGVEVYGWYLTLCLAMIGHVSMAVITRKEKSFETINFTFSQSAKFWIRNRKALKLTV